MTVTIDDLIAHNISTMDIGELEEFVEKTMREFYADNPEVLQEELVDLIDFS